jgi:hypothetical protein
MTSHGPRTHPALPKRPHAAIQWHAKSFERFTWRENAAFDAFDGYNRPIAVAGERHGNVCPRARAGHFSE